MTIDWETYSKIICLILKQPHSQLNHFFFFLLRSHEKCSIIPEVHGIDITVKLIKPMLTVNSQSIQVLRVGVTIISPMFTDKKGYITWKLRTLSSTKGIITGFTASLEIN